MFVFSWQVESQHESYFDRIADSLEANTLFESSIQSINSWLFRHFSFAFFFCKQFYQSHSSKDQYMVYLRNLAGSARSFLCTYKHRNTLNSASNSSALLHQSSRTHKMPHNATILVSATIDENPNFGYRSKFINALKENFTDIVSHEQVKSNPHLGENVWAAVIRPGLGDYVQNDKAASLYPNMKFIVSYGVGVDHVNFDYMHKRGISVANTPGVVADSTADMAMLLMLASARNFPHAYSLGMGAEAQCISVEDLSNDVCHATLGIVGMGDIGFRIAKRSYAFCMKILYHSRNRRSLEDEAQVEATYFSDLNEMLGQSDYVILACKMTPQTNKIMSTKQFNAMKKSGTIINIGRGKLVDQEALVVALNSGTIKAAALDVTDPEPLPRDHPLLKCPNVIILPHHGTATDETRTKMENVMIKNLLQAFRGEKMENEVNSN